jgi:hypothetical protein
MTENELAGRLHRDLGALACDAQWATTATDDQPQGHYTDPIADALEAAGLTSLADATAAQLKVIKRVALGLCLDRLEIHYAQAVDITGDGLSQALSQISANIDRVRKTLIGSVAVGVNLRGYRRPDYDVNVGNEDYSTIGVPVSELP